MNTGGHRPPASVPTLTEVVAWPDSETERMPLMPEALTAPAELPDVPDVPATTDAAPVVATARDDEHDHLVERVLAEVQRQVDLMLEYRLREALTPMLARLADSAVREARTELASALHDAVARAVAKELARHRGRGDV